MSPKLSLIFPLNQPGVLLTRSCSILFLSMLTASVQADSFYKCMGPNGVLMYSSSPCPKDAKHLLSWTVAAKAGGAPKEMLIKQDGSGHYVLEGAVNSSPLKFVLDTGASYVAIPDSLASIANLVCDGEIELQTANGTSKGCKVKLATLKFGTFSLNDVEAVMAPNLAQPLLGMNVLKRYKLTQEKDEMKISEQDPNAPVTQK